MNNIKEGDLYEVLEVYGHTFELRYGYYEERERARGEPIPIYPDFKKHPLYTKDGFPLVTQMQEPCIYGTCSDEDGCCVECKHYRHGKDLIGICTNKENRKK